MCCDTAYFTALNFTGPHTNPNGVQILGNNDHFQLDINLGHDKCAIRNIPCACVTCTSLSENSYTPGLSYKSQPCYQYVTYLI